MVDKGVKLFLELFRGLGGYGKEELSVVIYFYFLIFRFLGRGRVFY